MIIARLSAGYVAARIGIVQTLPSFWALLLGGATIDAGVGD